jgi:polar amino acid transport system substrate-binding protein
MTPAVAADLATIQDRGRLIVAVKDNLRPLGFRDRAGRLQGFEIDLAQRLAQDLLGRPDAVVLKPVRNRDRLRSVIDDQVDVAIAQVTCTPSRSRVVAFSLPYYADGTALITRDPSLRRLADISTQTLAVLAGSGAVETLRYRFPQATVVTVASYRAGWELLDWGGAIALAGDATVLTGRLSQSPDYRLITPTLSTAPLCMITPKGLQYDPLRRRIDEILRKWRAEGWLQERAAYWGLP